jgi:hypothetical protein
MHNLLRKSTNFKIKAQKILTKANKLKKQICTSELEVQTLSKAHTDSEQICT